MLEKFKNNKPRRHQISQNLLMVEKANGEYDVFIFKIHSETDFSVNNRRDFFYQVNYGKTPSEFSGELIISTITDIPIRGWRIESGKLLSRSKVAQTSKKTEAVNLSSTCGWNEEDHCEVSSGWFYDEEFGWDYGSEVNCTSYTQLECIDGDNSSQGPISGEGGSLGDGGGGGSGTLEPIEVSEFGFPLNPIHGQKYTYNYLDGRKVTFTYNEQLCGWLMPEFQSLLDNGYSISSNNLPNFNGQIITAIALPAFAEPTFIGEIILTGAIIYVTSIYVYDLGTYLLATESKLENLDHCMNLYVACTENTPYAPCGDCLKYCDTNEHWNFFDCPDVMLN
ncbi:hypothetical protein KIH41_17975 [Litoribacter ruber]|nr:hypothetical protein [Litoribacter ruber]